MKKVRKLLPLSISDIPGIEHWLEEQANAGLFPVFLDAWATFTPTGVPGTRFRLEPWGKTGTEPTPEQLQLYRSAGWEYAFPVGAAYFLFYTKDPDAVELYSDSNSRGLSLERLEKRVRRGRRIRVVFAAALVALLLWGLFFAWRAFDAQPDPFARFPLLLLGLCNPGILTLLVAAVFLWRQRRRDFRILCRTCQALKEGLPPPPSPGPSHRIVREQKIVLILIPLLLLVNLGLVLERHGDWTVPVEQFTRPYVPLQALEQEAVAPYETLFGPSDFHETENRAENHLSLLAPVWYEVSQDGYAVAEGDDKGISPNPDNGTYRYHPSLEMTYFHLLIPALARPVAEAQMDQYRAINLRWSYETLAYPGLDFVLLATEPEGIWQMAALAKGGRVAVFCYGGMEQLSEHLDELAAMVR